MRFKIGDIVAKKSGYKFIGKVVSAYQVEGGNRYDVQVDGTIAVARLHRLIKEEKITNSAKALIELEDMLMNCHGMIHIFSEEQLSKYESNLD